MGGGRKHEGIKRHKGQVKIPKVRPQDGLGVKKEISLAADNNMGK